MTNTTIDITPRQSQWLGRIFNTPYIKPMTQHPQIRDAFMLELTRLKDDPNWQDNIDPELMKLVNRGLRSADIKVERKLDDNEEVLQILEDELNREAS